MKPLPPEDSVRGEAFTDLLAEALAVIDEEGFTAAERIIQAHPAHADELTERIRILRELGLVGNPPEKDGAIVPDRLGDFRLLECLGQGGMGVVYLALQESIDREVALKVIRPDFMLFEKSRSRFRREIEACARLTHPGIVRIYTVGEERGIPYFAMERIEGETLGKILARFHGRAPEALGGHDLCASYTGTWIEACLDVVRQVAEALDHAHEHGVLHRDVKPSNVVVTPTGRAVLFDFGLAAVEDAGRLTGSRAELGSLPYMAPEQLEGNAESQDVRTDVYSLAVTLYELLTLRTPYGADSSTEIRWRILDGRPPAPRVLNRDLSWEVETVCLTAMSPEPSLRYASASAFVQDLENVLAGRPIRARRPGPFHVARRWVQRHRGAAAALCLALVLVIGGPIAFGLVQKEAMSAVEAESQRAQKEADTAQRLYRFLVENFITLDPLVAQGEEPTLDELLEQNAKLVETDLQDQPEVQASLLETIGNVLVRRHHLDRAEELLEGALHLRREVLPYDGPALSYCLKSVGTLLVELAEYERAEELQREALEIRKDLVAGGSDEVGPADLATSMNDLAETLRFQGRFDEAEELYSEACEILRDLDGADPVYLAMVANNYGSLELARGRYEEAEELYTEALELRRGVLGEDHPHLIMSWLSLCVVAQERGELDVARAQGERALETARRIYDGDHPDIAAALSGLAEVHIRNGDPAGAEPLARESLEMFGRLVGEDHPDYAFRLGQLGKLLADQGRYGEAASLARESLARVRAIYGDDHPETGTSCYFLAGILKKDGGADEAAELYAEALEIYLSSFGEGHPFVISARRSLADAHVRRGAYGDAEPILRELLLHQESEEVVDERWLSWTQSLLGHCLARMGRPDEGEELLVAAYARLEANQGLDDPWTVTAGERLAELRRNRDETR